MSSVQRRHTNSSPRYPLTSTQREIWFDQMLHPDLPLYNIGGYVDLPGEIDPRVFEQAVNRLVQRHDALRLQLLPETDEDGVALQTVVAELSVLVPVHDVSAEPEPEQAALAWMNQRFSEPYTLIQSPLFRYALVRVAENRYFWLMVYHHLIVDGWGVALLVRSLGEIYSDLQAGRAPTLEAPSYTAFIDADRVYITSPSVEAQRRYWREHYQVVPEPLLNPGYHHNHKDLAPSQMSSLVMPRAFYDQLEQLGQRHQASRFHVLLAALYIYFTRTAGREELVVGLPVLNRANARFRQTVGLFVGTSPVCFALGTDLEIGELLQGIARTLKANYRHQRLPMSEIHRTLGLDAERRRLFDVSLSYESHDYDAQFGDIHSHFNAMLHPWEQTPLLIFVRDFHAAAQVKFDFVYNTAYFAVEEVMALQQRFMVILEGMLSAQSERIRHLALMPAAEVAQLQAWNQTAVDFPAEQTVVDLFEAQVERTPENIAVVFEGETLTYSELNTRANRLAHALIDQDVGPEVLVGLCVERSPALVVALLAILKAEGIYVPLDPTYPAAWLHFMVEDSNPAIILTQTALRHLLPDGAHALALDAITLPDRAQALPRHASGCQSAYLIYTSGSTGQPRGVLGHHQGLLNRFAWMWQHVPFDEQERLAAKTALGFVDSLWELLGGLLQGVPTVLISEANRRDVVQLVESLARACVTRIVLVPSLLEALLEVPDVGQRLASIRHWTSSGEALSPRLARAFYQCFPDARLLNLYGSSEVAADVLYFPVPATPTAVWLGRSLSNTRVYVLDSRFQPLPVGISGELYIGGVQVGVGYLNRPELTAERFIKIELFGHTERVYRTGDLARWLPDGNLEYLGRIDQQVKLRGFRIEPGEIEAVLTRHESVREAAVVLRESAAGAALAAYVTPSEVSPDPATLRDWLKTHLPDYMIPTTITVLETLPLTPNGKLNRRALPEPVTITTATDHALRTETEQLLAGLWQQVLGVAVTQGDADFFALGGHSLLATRVASRVRETFGVEMSLSVLFGAPVLADQAAWLDQQQRGVVLPPLTPQAPEAPRVLSYAQQRLWFLSRLEGRSATYNMPAALHLKGTLDQPALAETFRQLVARHQSLRLCFPELDGTPSVVELPAFDPLVVSDLRSLQGEQQWAEVYRLVDEHALTPFDLETGPLMRVRLLILGETDHVLLLNLHHSTADGWSIGVLVREWTILYHAACDGVEADLPLLPIQYTDYAAWQRQRLQGEALQRQLDYWLETLDGAPQLLELPADHPRPMMLSYRGAHLKSRLDGDLHHALLSLSRERGATLFMTLLAAFSVLLQRYTGQGDLLLGSPIANRTQQHMENLIGFFINTLVLRTRPSEVSTFEELLTQVRETALGAYAHQDLPFEQLVEHLNLTRSLSHNPLFQVMLILQNNEIGPLTLPGLDIEPLARDTPIAKFDLTLNAEPTDDGLLLTWEYATDLFEHDRIERMAAHFEVLLRGIVEHPDGELHRLPLLTETETAQLIDWNRTTVDFPHQQTVVDLFEAQVERGPENIAVVFEGEALTYAQLNTRANQLAHALIARGVGPEVLVGLCVERSLEMVVGLFAILKAGGAYVPLDPDYPPERLRFMVTDSQPRVVLTVSSLANRLPSNTIRLLLDKADALTDQLTHNPAQYCTPTDLAYVIYTSGSTGKPKGTLLTHGGLTNYLHWAVMHYEVTAGGGAPVQSTLSFDATITSLYLPLITGKPVVLMPQTSPMEALAKHLAQGPAFSLLKLTPGQLEMIHQQLPAEAFVNATRVLVLGGETLNAAQLAPWWRHAPTIRLINEYGPTEAVVGCCVYDARGHSTLSGMIPIGKPIANTQLYVLNAHQQLLPIGVAGELCIAGVGLARGYINRPDLTAEKFIEVEVFGHTERVYRTGDLARWRPDGNLEYLGRIDHQVKLRGFRIEPGEIEAVLVQHESVREAVVVLRDGPVGLALAAYLTPGEGTPDPATLRDWLKTQLPDYMIPTTITVLETLPLTPNGKLNRRALPAPDVPTTATQALPPRDAVEWQLLTLWQRILGVDRLGSHQSFFALGGHSLLAVRLMGEIHRQFGVSLPVSLLFQHPTVATIADHLRGEVTLPKWDHCIPIHAGGDNPPLFLLPGALGSVLYLQPLAAALGTEQPLYALETPGLRGEETPDTVTALARFHLEALRSVQPHGPYRLLGHSSGGQVAFEIAHQLEQADETVAFLGILDTNAPDPDKTPTLEDHPLDWLWQLVEIFQILTGVNLDLSREALSTLDDSDAQAQVLAACQHREILFASGTSLETFSHWRRVYRATILGQAYYRSQAYLDCPIKLFRAQEGLAESVDKRPAWGWHGHTRAGVEEHIVPGGHITMMLAPQVESLAGAIRKSWQQPPNSEAAN